MREEKEYLSKEKFEEFKKELEFLISTKRKEIAQDLDYARSLGDLSENAEYQEAREAQANLEDRISKLELIVKNAVIVDNKHETGKISIGSTVTVVKDGDKTEKKFVIVGSEEADLATGKISFVSPIGAGLLGKKKGEEVAVQTPRGEVRYKILGIE